jgi:hypothetical protein
LNLSQNINLRSLAITDIDIRYIPVNGTLSISDIVSKISSLGTDISVEMWAYRSLANPCSVDWQELAEVLNRPQISQLQNVSIFIDGSKNKAWVRKEMSGLALSRELQILVDCRVVGKI